MAGETPRSASPSSGASAPPGTLEVRGLVKSFRAPGRAPAPVLDGLDLQVRRGEFVSIVGPSACGKTTLLHILAGLEAPTAGTVQVDRERLAVVFQRPLLFPWRSVLANVTFSQECRGRRRADVTPAALALLERLRLGGAAGLRPFELSQGMRQRVDLARALLVEPTVLLMDEPFASLDAATRAEMHAVLLDVWREFGFTVVFVSHDLEEVVLLSDRVVFLSEKPTRVTKVVEIGLPRPRGATPEARAEVYRLARELEG